MIATLQHYADLAGFGAPLPVAIVFALLWLGPMLVYSPAADWIASQFVAAPPSLDIFRRLQQSRLKLALGIAVAWALGGFAEELMLRGIVLQVVAAAARPLTGAIAADAAGIFVAAALAAVLHLYQGKRAALIIAQLSALFGLLFVVSGNNLWAAVLCHGLYDTIAFVRFANGSSRYSR